MANNVNNVNVGKPKVSGAVHIAPLTATLPTTVDDTLTGFVDAGYVSEDGVVNSTAADSDTIHAWGGDAVMNINKDTTDTFKFMLIESSNAEVLKLIYGSSAVTTGTGTIDIAVGAKDTTGHMFVIDMVLRNNYIKRICIPHGVVTEIGDIVYKDDELIGYDITITCMPDASKNTHYEHLTVAS